MNYRYFELDFLLGIAVVLMVCFHFDPVLAYSVEQFYIPSNTVDFVSFTPWFCMVLIGMYFMLKKLFGIIIKENKRGRRVALLGKHSFIIYLLHQPVLFRVFTVIKFIR